MDAQATPDERGRCGRPSRVVLISRRWDQACAWRTHKRRWLSSPAHRGEREAAVKTNRAGNAGCFRRTCGDLLACFLHCTQGCGCVRCTGIPCALSILEGSDDAPLGHFMPRECERSSLRGGLRRVGKATAFAMAQRAKAEACPPFTPMMMVVGTAQGRLCPPYAAGFGSSPESRWRELLLATTHHHLPLARVAHEGDEAVD